MLHQGTRAQARLQEMGIDEPKIRRELQTDGFSVVHGFLSEEIRRGVGMACNTIIDKMLESMASENKPIMMEPGAGTLSKKLLSMHKQYPEDSPKYFSSELHVKGMYDVFLHPDAIDLGMDLTGCEELRLCAGYRVNMHYPRDEPKKAYQIGHLDRFGKYLDLEPDALHKALGYPNKRRRAVGLWAPIAPNTENGASITVYTASHLLGALSCSTSPQGDMQLDTSVVQDCKRETIALTAGDMLVYHPWLVVEKPTFQPLDDQVGFSIDWMYQDTAAGEALDVPAHVVRSLVDMDREIQEEEEWIELQEVAQS
eukprot:m.6379 g.6379  ORF g.6379 m.6379 type:complete len:312 (+) comp3524_c0_seq1:204-1139(+)